MLDTTLPDTETTGPCGSGTVRPEAVLRQAGVDRVWLTQLHSEQVEQAWVTRARLTNELNQVTRALENELYDVIGCSRAEHRGRLVAVRRAIHNGRSDDPALRDAGRLLPTSTAQGVQRWHRLLRSVQASRQALADAVCSREDEEQEVLRRALNDPAFRRGVEATSRSLSAVAKRWRISSDQPRRSKILRLGRLLARATAKTSPFSSFLVSSPVDLRAQYDGNDVTKTVWELDGECESALINVMARLDTTRSEALLRANPSVTQTPKGYLFFQPSPGEPIMRADSHPAVQQILLECEGRTRRELVELFGGGRAQELIDSLIESGLVECVVPIADDDPHTLVTWAEHLERSQQGSLAFELRAVGSAVERGDASSVEEHVQRICGHLSSTLPEPRLHEMTVASRPVLPWSGLHDPHGTMGEELDAVRRLHARIDAKLPMKMAADEFFARTSGGDYDIDLLSAIGLLREEYRLPARESDVARLLGPTAPPWGSDLTACLSSRLRRHGKQIDRLRRSVLELAENGPLTVDDVDALLVDVEQPHVNRSATMYLQETRGESGVERVVNVVHGGHGRGVGRLAHQLGAPAPLESPEDSATSGEVIEMCGLLGSTLNRRAGMTSRELQYPGGLSSRSRGQQVRLGDLRVRRDHDLGVPALHDQYGTRLRPVHLGMSADLALPPVAASVERIFGSAFLVHPSAPPFTPHTPGGGVEGVVHTPRIAVGRTVIQRERWFAARDDMPRTHDHLHDTIAEWSEWLSERGLPARAYLRSWSAKNITAQMKSRKPLYVDFTSWILASDAMKLLAHQDFVLIDECLPDPLVGEGPVREIAVGVDGA